MFRFFITFDFLLTFVYNFCDEDYWKCRRSPEGSMFSETQQWVFWEFWLSVILEIDINPQDSRLQMSRPAKQCLHKDKTSAYADWIVTLSFHYQIVILLLEWIQCSLYVLRYSKVSKLYNLLNVRFWSMHAFIALISGL